LDRRVAAAVVALAILVGFQSQQITVLKDQVRMLVETERAVAKSARAPAPVEEAPTPVAEAKPVEPVAAAPIPQAETAEGTTNNFMAGLAAMMKNPSMKEMVRAQQKASLDRTYGGLSKYLNLSTNEMDALNELLSQRQMALMDSGMAMMSGSEEDKKQAMEDAKAVKADYDKKISDLLGSQDYPVSRITRRARRIACRCKCSRVRGCGFYAD